MKGSKEYIEEDWEKEADKDIIYLEEDKKMKESEFWAWYKDRKGKIKVIGQDKKEMNDYFLPF